MTNALGFNLVQMSRGIQSLDFEYVVFASTQTTICDGKNRVFTNEIRWRLTLREWVHEYVMLRL